MMTETKPTKSLTDEKRAFLERRILNCLLTEHHNPTIPVDWFSHVPRKMLYQAIKKYSPVLVDQDVYRNYLLETISDKGKILVPMQEFYKCQCQHFDDNYETLELQLEQAQDKVKKKHLIDLVGNHLTDNYDNLANNVRDFIDDTVDRKTKQLDYSKGSSVKTKKVNWLWKGRIAFGKTNLLSGEPCVGKGALYCDIAARVSNGTALPFTGEIHKKSVVVLSAEDDYADTVVPRLKAAGADLNNIYLVNGVKNSSLLSLDKDLDAMEQILQNEPNIGLIIIDPISSYFGCTKDIEHEVRAFLKPIEKLAQKWGVAVLIIKHFKKGKSNAKERVAGSLSWTASVRCALGLSSDKTNEEIKHLYVIKSNLTKTPKSITFTTIPSKMDNEIVCIEWGNETNFKADDFTDISTEQNKVSQCAEFLKELLGSTSMESETIFEYCEESGFSRNTVYRAKEQLHIKARKDGFQGKWVWELNEHPKNKNEDSQQDKNDDLQL